MQQETEQQSGTGSFFRDRELLSLPCDGAIDTLCVCFLLNKVSCLELRTVMKAGGLDRWGLGFGLFLSFPFSPFSHCCSGGGGGGQGSALTCALTTPGPLCHFLLLIFPGLKQGGYPPISTKWNWCIYLRILNLVLWIAGSHGWLKSPSGFCQRGMWLSVFLTFKVRPQSRASSQMSRLSPAVTSPCHSL